MSAEQRITTKKISSESRYISKLSNASVACSVTGVGLLCMILIGPVNAMDYKNIHLVCDCAFCLLSAAVVLGIIASLFSIFKKDSNKSPNRPQHAERSRTVKQTLQRASGNTIPKCPNKTVVTDVKDVGLKVPDANPFKSVDNSNSTSTVPESGGIAETSKKRSSLLESRKQCPVTENRLVPVTKYQNPLSSEQFRTGFPYQVAEHCNYFSTNSLASSPVSEVVATRTMRFLADGNVQEELKFQRTIFQYPKVGMSYQQSVPTNSNLHNREKFGKYMTSSKNHVSDVISKLESFNFSQLN